MRFEWTVAVRFLREGGLQTLMIVAGAAAGISVIVFMTGFLGDLQADLIRRTLGVQANIIVRPAEEVARPLREGRDALPQVQARVQRLRSVDQWQALRQRLENTPGIRAVSPIAAGPGLMTRGDTNKSVNALAGSSTATAVTGSVVQSVKLPGVRTAMPSAMVFPPATVTQWPASMEAFMQGTASVSTPMTRMLGLVSLMAQAMPAMRPPPPMGTTTAWR